MSTNIETYKEDLSKLLDMGEKMEIDLEIRRRVRKGKISAKLRDLEKKLTGCFELEYQRWYTESHAVIRQLIPNRVEEFEELYKGEGRRKGLTATNYNIQDWMTGLRSPEYATSGDKLFDDFGITFHKLHEQVQILRSAESRFETALHDLKRIVHADLFDSELAPARELRKNGFLRGAGAIAGVVLEKHLAEICVSHSIRSRKKNPAISDFNELLKKHDVLDIPNWRFIQRLGDLRNLCDHNKDREPSNEEVEELISGVDKVSKTIY